MKKRAEKTLSLRPETLRVLGDLKLVEAVGGAVGHTGAGGMRGNTCGCPPANEA